MNVIIKLNGVYLKVVREKLYLSDILDSSISYYS